ELRLPGDPQAPRPGGLRRLHVPSLRLHAARVRPRSHRARRGMSATAPPASRGPDPSSIVRLSTAYWDSQTLLTANRLGVFDFLAEGARTTEEVAAGLQLDPRSTGLFLRACVGLGFLVDEAGRFANAPVA